MWLMNEAIKHCHSSPPVRSLIIPPYVVWAGYRLSLLFFIHSFILYDYGFLSRGFTDRREILHGGSAASQTGFLLFWGIAPGIWPSFWRQQVSGDGKGTEGGMRPWRHSAGGGIWRGENMEF